MNPTPEKTTTTPEKLTRTVFHKTQAREVELRAEHATLVALANDATTQAGLEKKKLDAAQLAHTIDPSPATEQAVKDAEADIAAALQARDEAQDRLALVAKAIPAIQEKVTEMDRRLREEERIALRAEVEARQKNGADAAAAWAIDACTAWMAFGGNGVDVPLTIAEALSRHGWTTDRIFQAARRQLDACHEVVP